MLFSHPCLHCVWDAFKHLCQFGNTVAGDPALPAEILMVGRNELCEVDAEVGGVAQQPCNLLCKNLHPGQLLLCFCFLEHGYHKVISHLLHEHSPLRQLFHHVNNITNPITGSFKVSLETAPERIWQMRE